MPPNGDARAISARRVGRPGRARAGGCARRRVGISGEAPPAGMNIYGFVGNRPLLAVDTDGRFPLIVIPIIVGSGLLAGCSEKSNGSDDEFKLKPRDKINNLDTWMVDKEKSKYVPKCMVVVYVGHNGDVPQGEVKQYRVVDPKNNKERPCSGSMTIGCGDLSGGENSDTNPCSSTVPGSPSPISGVPIDLITAEEQLKAAEDNARWYAQIICLTGCCKCKVVTVVFHYFSDIGGLSMKKGTQKSYEVICGE